MRFPIFFFLISLILISCKEKQGINQWIKEDLAKPKPVANFEISTEDLPKNKVVSEHAHSSITFRVGHWEIVDLFGWFRDFEAVMYHDEADFSDALIEARVNPKAVILPAPQMEGHIQNPEYFHSDKYPFIVFKSRKMKPVGGNKYKLLGDLIIKETKLEKELDVTFNGYAYPEKSISGWKVNGFVTQTELGWENTAKLHSGRMSLNDTIWFEANLRMQ